MVKSIRALAALSLLLLPSLLWAERIQVAATPVPHAELLEFVRPQLAREGIQLEVRIFTDYVQPNQQVAQKRMDANFFQHQPYLDEFNHSRGTRLVSLGRIHVEPIGAYSHKVKRLEELPERAEVAIPNDVTNGGRALLLLQEAGLIRLREEAGIEATVRDIQDNPRRLRFRELEAAILPRLFRQVDLALINTNYALEAGLDPERDALYMEGAGSPYANILVTHADRADDPALQKLLQALQGEATREFMLRHYHGAVVPVH